VDVSTGRPTQEEFAKQARTFLDAHAQPRPAAEEFSWGVGSDAVALFAEPSSEERAAELGEARRWRRLVFDAGFGWLSGPVEWGGRGLPLSYERTYTELERLYTVPSIGPFAIGLGMVAPTLLAHGTDDAKRRWLRALYRGDAIGCQLFSEPGAGSDLASVTTSAVREDESWIINGQKVWSSGAHFSDVGLVLTRSGGGPRHRNLTAFLIDMAAPGIDVRPLRQMTGGAAFNEVFLKDVVVADDHRLGDVDGGWRVAITTLMNERAAVGGPAGGGGGVLSHARLVGLARRAGRADDPIVRQRLAQVYVDLELWRLNRRRAVARSGAGQIAGPEMSMAKVALTCNLQSVAELVGELLGPWLVADADEWGTYAWTQFVLGVPGVRLGGGTDEIMRTIVAERVLGLPKEPVPDE
jgi:alkylation response protein AidB-like acyl-CoA dehydrogenase